MIVESRSSEVNIVEAGKVAKAIEWLNRVIRRNALNRNRLRAELRRRDKPAPQRPDCGGYNEAFIVQTWTHYDIPERTLR